MTRASALMLFAICSTAAFASNCPNGDELLNSDTSLATLCPNGFGQFQPGSIQNAINNQQGNTQMIVAAAEQDGVPVDLALAVAYHESEGFNSCAGSDTGVKGPMQLTQTTARGLGYNRDINEQNIKGGMAVLKRAFDICGATNYACLSSNYNGSPRPGEQAGWARGVERADSEIKSNPTLEASACQGGTLSCGPGDFPSMPIAGNATQPPASTADMTLPASAG